jgi:hypothetical protein
MGFIGPILKAIAAAFAVWQLERALRNSPEQVKNKLDIAKQQATDALRNAESVTADPNATPEQHAEALRQIRLAGS